MAPRRELGSTEHCFEWEFPCVCNSSLVWKESRNSGRSFPYKTASPVAKLKGSCSFLFRRCSSPSSFLQGGGKKRWKQHEHLLWARQNHPPNSETGAHSPALAFLKKRVLDWAGWDAADGGLWLWGAHGEVCMVPGMAACPGLTCSPSQCLQPPSQSCFAHASLLQEGTYWKVLTVQPNHPFLHPHCLCVPRAAPRPHTLRAGEGSWRSSDTHDRARCRAMMQSGLPPLYTSRALACTHTQPPFLVSSRKTVSPLSPVFITGAGREERQHACGYSMGTDKWDMQDATRLSITSHP